MKMLWNYWFDGDVVDKIGPWRFLCDRNNDIPRKSRRTFVKAKDCILKLIDVGVKQGKVSEAASLLTLSRAERDKFFHDTMSALIEELGLTSARSRKFRNDSKYTTVYNALHSKKSKKLEDEDEEGGEEAEGAIEEEDVGDIEK